MSEKDATIQKKLMDLELKHYTFQIKKWKI